MKEAEARHLMRHPSHARQTQPLSSLEIYPLLLPLLDKSEIAMTSLLGMILPTGIHLPTFFGRSDDPAIDTTETQDKPPGDSINDNSPDKPDDIPPNDLPPEHVQEHSVKKRERKPETETFIIVRPPPSKSNHPLNLQIQLVPPHGPRDRIQRQSVDFSSRDEILPPHDDPAGPPVGTDLGLSRRPSVRSDRSASLYSSIASTSVTSLSSTASGRRIVPLYNLSAHNVMQNTVLDAGTDAKVAKFTKKAVEVVDVAFLEPLEVWDPHADPALHRLQTRASDISHSSQGEDTTPRVPVLHVRHASSSSPPHSGSDLLTPQHAEHAGGKKMFGKMFGKRRQPSISETPLPATQPALTKSSLPARPSPAPSNDPHLQPPTLGTQPTLVSSVYPPHGRPWSYIWVVRKWTKPTGESWLNKGLTNLRIGSSSSAGGDIEVHFEWARAGDGSRGRPQDRSQRKSVDVREGSSRPQSMSFASDQPGLPVPSPTPSIKGRSPSPAKPGGATLLPPVSNETSSTHSDSDPEDSDTPWTCTLHILPIDTRLRVAALVPAPHHPKLLGQVKMPFPLPDVSLDTGALIPRVEGESSVDAGVLMTAEDIKDIIATTCLWLVVRESFGGINKKRKGDGWRIRS